MVRGLDSLGKGLREHELIVERSRGQVVVADELLRVGDPFVDQNQAGTVPVEQLVEQVAGIRAVPVVLRD